MANLNKTQREYLLNELREKNYNLINKFDQSAPKEKKTRTAGDQVGRNAGREDFVKLLATIKSGTYVVMEERVDEDGETYFDADDFLEALIHKDDVDNGKARAAHYRLRAKLSTALTAELKKVERALIFADTSGVEALVKNYDMAILAVLKQIK